MADQFRRPLKRRTAAERARLLRPTPLQAASGLTGVLLAAALLWMMLVPWPMPSSPVVRMAMGAGDPVITASTGVAVVLDHHKRAEGEATNEASALPAIEPPADAVSLDALPTSSDDADVEHLAADQPVVIGADRLSMVAAPVGTVAESGPYGPLPRIAKDGRKPWQVYARPIHRQALAGGAPKVAIILGGMGLNGALTDRAIRELPGEVSFAFAPYPEGLQRLVNRARADGHEIYLQLPMEPLGYPKINPGPHTLLASMSPQETLDNLAWFMSRFAGYAGVMNYMGAELIANGQALGPMMAELGRRGLVFLDDGSFARSQAEEAGQRAGVPIRRAHLMIDGDSSEAAIGEALQRLEAMAARQGLAVGVGSGLPSTIKAVARWADTAKSRGIVLVPVSAYFR
jgi:polysaccharide deacetylase 2 family uncharacterized protein YibQ